MASFRNTQWDIKYAPSDVKEVTRTVGIEFEVNVNSLNSAYNELNLDRVKEKIRRESGKDFYSIDWKAQVQEKDFPIAAWGVDGGDKEFVTHPDSYTYFKRGGSKRFKQVMEYLINFTEPHIKSGTHIHISQLETDDLDKINDNLYWVTAGFGEQIQKIFGRSSHWCRPPEAKNQEGELIISPVELLKITYPKPKQTPKQDNYTKSRMFNIHSYGTYEFRGGKSSTNILEILAWVQFCYNIVDICATTDDITKVKFSEFLTGVHIRRYVKTLKKSKAREITPKELNRTIGNSVTFSYYVKDKIL